MPKYKIRGFEPKGKYIDIRLEIYKDDDVSINTTTITIEGTATVKELIERLQTVADNVVADVQQQELLIKWLEEHIEKLPVRPRVAQSIRE